MSTRWSQDELEDLTDLVIESSDVPAYELAPLIAKHFPGRTEDGIRCQITKYRRDARQVQLDTLQPKPPAPNPKQPEQPDLFKQPWESSDMGAIAAILLTIGETLQSILKRIPAAAIVFATLLIGSMAAAEDMQLGTNVPSVSDWSQDWITVDAFTQSRQWVSGLKGKWDDGRKLTLDEHGYPKSLLDGQEAHTIMLVGEARAGEYLISYTGAGAIDYRAGAKLIEHHDGLDRVSMTPPHGLTMAITATDPDNNIRNITVRHVDDQAINDRWNPIFIERMLGYRVVRFMNWTKTNEPWTASRLPNDDDAQWPASGVPVSAMCDLADILDADPWFCIHHQWDDATIREFAEQVKTHLPPDRKAHIELSNEIWNPQYAQAKYYQNEGLAAGLSTNAFQARLMRQAQRSLEVFAIWEDVFGGHDRLVRVMASQAANAWTAKQLLGFNGFVQTPDGTLVTKTASENVDVIAIAPYFGGRLDDATIADGLATWTPDQLLDQLQTVYIPEAIEWTTANKAVADSYGVQLIAYEAGQHLVWNRGVKVTDAAGVAINALFDAANRHPRMGLLYTDYLCKLDTAGVDLTVHLHNAMKWGTYGRWGALEHIDQDPATAPKYAAIRAWLDLQNMPNAPLSVDEAVDALDRALAEIQQVKNALQAQGN